MLHRFDPSRITAAIVDLDGTMVDTLGDFVAAVDATLREMALARVTPDFIERSVGQGSEHLVRCVLAEAGGAPSRYDEAFAIYQRHYGLVNGRHSAVFPGVVEGLQRLATRGLRLACLTNKPGAFAQSLLAAKQLDGYFEVVFGGDAFERKKPDPLPLLRTCAALGVEPARTLMLGDSRNDAQAARAAGCPVVLVTYGYNHGEPVRPELADALIDRLDALPL